MRFLVDKNVSYRICRYLTDAGYEASHVDDISLSSAPDEEILDVAAEQRWVIISSDTDFGALLAAQRASAPSVILTREVSTMTAPMLAALLVANLPAVEEALDDGAVVAVGPRGIRVRRLP